MLSTSNISIRFGSRTLFENISVQFSDNNRYGLIGANGSGKSTFMKILSGELESTTGIVIKSPNERISVLQQNQFGYEEYSVINTVIMGHKELWKITEERERLYALSDLTEEEGMRLGDLEGEYAELNGYSSESLASDLLLGVGIPLDQHYNLMSAISPGFKLRILLVQALFADPDILLLDEPTNNLDIESIQWLERVLIKTRSTIVIISHDRQFLNTVCTHTADIDYESIQTFPGNYDQYMIASAEAKMLVQKENAKKKTQITDLKNFVSRFSANASKAKQASSRQKQLDKIQLVEIKPSSRRNPHIVFEQKKRLHKEAVIIKNLSKGFENLSLFKDVNMSIDAGERIAIIGVNGIGKTTFINCLLNEIEADAGTVKWAQNAQISYFKQDNNVDFLEETNLFEWMFQYKQKEDDEQSIRNVLGRLLFSQDEIKKSVKVLSGGEKSRLLFGKFMLQKSNVLIMDEATNHLDMESIESLNQALIHYTGTLLFISHDREFISSIATRIIEITADEVINFGGTYAEYVDYKKRREAK